MAPKPKTYDIVIVGAGPVGLLLSVCLARWGYRVRHIDNRPLPTATGRADGLQPRTLEILKNLRLKSQIMSHEPARVFEVAFWDPSSDGKIVRTGTWASCPDFLDARYPFTALLHQGLIERVLIDDLRENDTYVQRPWTITGFKTDDADAQYPVEVDLKNLDSNVTETVRAKYLFSGEGARSFIRDQLGVKVRHKDPISHVWGVMDGVVRTNFPDIKMKCTIHSDHGSIMVIPREGNMVRLYIQLASSTDPDFNPRRTATTEEVQAAAKRILSPYYISWDRIEWYSVYPIGQGIADKYTLDHRVFMGGDVCHTHSPKAGQGMNTAFHDAVNLAWKLHLVESGYAKRSILETYEVERKHIAEALLDFDSKYATLFSQRAPSASEVSEAGGGHQSQSANAFVETFKESCEFTAGFGVAYLPNIFNYSPANSPLSSHPLLISDNPRLRPGRILPPSNVTRVVDANRVHLEDQIPFNGAFRLFVFGGAASKPRTGQHPLLDTLASLLQGDNSFYTRFAYSTTSFKHGKSQRDHLHHSSSDASSNLSNAITNDESGRDLLELYHETDNPHSRLFSLALILACKRSEIEISQLPHLFQDYRERIYADDLWDPRVPDAKAASHAKVGLGGDNDDDDNNNNNNNFAEAALIIVRPDGHVGLGIRLQPNRVEEAIELAGRYFDAFLEPSRRPDSSRKENVIGTVKAQL